MFEGFSGLAGLAGLMGKLPKIKEEVQNLQQRIAQITVEGSAGGDLVKVKANGKMELTACVLSDEALKMNDKEMLEDLIRVAVNQALERAKQQAGEETGKLATNLGLPAGMSLPGLFS